MSKLLIDEYPLIVLPTLAAKIGLNEAIFLQQLNYWLGSSHHERDGKKWVYNTFDEWQKQLPFWPVVTIKRIVKSLRESGIILTTSQYNKMPMDRTLWYTIDYDALDKLSPELPSYQNDTIEENQPLPSYRFDTMVVSKRYDGEYQNDTSNNQRLPETTTENVSTKRTAQKPPSTTKAILDAFVKSKTEHEPGAIINYGKEGKAAQQIAKQGWTPEQVVECGRMLYDDPFYQDKSLSLMAIATQIGAKLQRSPPPGNAPPSPPPCEIVDFDSITYRGKHANNNH